MEIQLTPAPPEMKSPVAPATAPASNSPPGWWTLADLIGSREGVLGAVTASNIPDRWKAVLQAEIAALDAKFNHIELDAHFQVVAGKCNLHLTISPSTVL